MMYEDGYDHDASIAQSEALLAEWKSHVGLVKHTNLPTAHLLDRPIENLEQCLADEKRRRDIARAAKKKKG